MTVSDFEMRLRLVNHYVLTIAGFVFTVSVLVRNGVTIVLLDSVPFCVQSSNGVILRDCIYSCGQIVAGRVQHRCLNSFPLVPFSRSNVPLSCSYIAVPHKSGDREGANSRLT